MVGLQGCRGQKGGWGRGPLPNLRNPEDGAGPQRDRIQRLLRPPSGSL